ncbi:unnamed protein product, partial [Amoebophrya sp. A25]|eukprot:GSA25T00026751001.1
MSLLRGLDLSRLLDVPLSALRAHQEGTSSSKASKNSDDNMTTVKTELQTTRHQEGKLSTKFVTSVPLVEQQRPLSTCVSKSLVSETRRLGDGVDARVENFRRAVEVDAFYNEQRRVVEGGVDNERRLPSDVSRLCRENELLTREKSCTRSSESPEPEERPLPRD